MEKLKLAPRLAVVASFVSTGSSVIDVGTDHGYIPVWLVQNGICEKVMALDKRSGPLSAAREHARAFGVDDKIQFLLSDGLDDCPEDSADTVIISGMGGETIAGIIARAPWLLERRIKLILQPQSKTQLLYDWMRENGYMITDAALVKDAGRIYTVFTAQAGPGDGRGQPIFIDWNLIGKRDPLLPEYLDTLTKKLEKKIAGLARSGNEENRAALDECRAALDYINTTRQELKA